MGPRSKLLCSAKFSVFIWRLYRTGPKFMKIGSAVSYKPGDIETRSRSGCVNQYAKGRCLGGWRQATRLRSAAKKPRQQARKAPGPSARHLLDANHGDGSSAFPMPVSPNHIHTPGRPQDRVHAFLGDITSAASESAQLPAQQKLLPHEMLADIGTWSHHQKPSMKFLKAYAA
jgi:hypothetical protein